MKRVLKSIGEVYLGFFVAIIFCVLINIPVLLAYYTGIEEYGFLYIVHAPVLLGIIHHYMEKNTK